MRDQLEQMSNVDGIKYALIFTGVGIFIFVPWPQGFWPGILIAGAGVILHLAQKEDKEG